MVYKLDLTTVFFTYGDVIDYIPMKERSIYVSYNEGHIHGVPILLIHQDKFDVVESVPYKETADYQDKVFLLQIKNAKIYFVIFRFGGMKKDGRLLLSHYTEGTRQYEQVLGAFYSDSLIDAKKEFRIQISNMFR